MLSHDRRRLPILPMIGMLVATLATFDAIRVLMTLGSRSAGLRIGALVVVSGVVVFTTPLVERAGRTVIIIVTGVLMLGRVLLQALPPSPSPIGMGLAAAIVLGLFGVVVALNATVFGGRVVGLSLVMAAAIDVVIQVSLATLPLVWWPGVVPLLTVILAAMVAIACGVIDQRLTMPTRLGARAPAVGIAMCGAWVALHVMLIGNLGWLNSLSGADPSLVVTAVSLGLAGALVWETQGRSGSRPAVAGVIAFMAGALFAAADGGWALILVAVVTAVSGVALTGALERDSSAAPERVQWAVGVVPALAIVPVAVRELDRLGTRAAGIAVVGTVVVILAAAVLSTRHNPGASGRAPAAALVGIGAAIAAVAVSLIGSTDPVAPATEGELLVATFNMQRGFTPEGEFDPHAAAQVLIDLGADVAAVQDVTRGRIKDGAADLVVFLERRTGTDVVWVGEDDGTGAALELRVPTVAVDDRSVDGVVNVLETWIGEEDTAIRVLAVDAVGAPTASHDVGGLLADIWGGQQRTVMAGSFDGSAASEPVVSLFNAGLFDVTLVLADLVPLTSPAELPTVQQDYILISQDLRPAGARVAESTSSDHLPVISRVAVPEN